MYSWKRMCMRLSAGMSRKALVLALALTMILASAAGGTLAWLHADPQQVNNVFIHGDISVSLTETDTGLDDDDDPTTNLYEMGLGQAIDKDPVVTVQAASEDCWLFVHMDESANFADFMSYAMADGWTLLAGETGVYYRAVNYAAEDQAFPVLRDNVVAMKADVSLDMMASLTGADYPTLSITAWAVQRDATVPGVSTPDAAWATMQAQENPVH